MHDRLHLRHQVRGPRGAFWRSLYNRMLVNPALGNVVVALLVTAQGRAGQKWAMLASLGAAAGLVGRLQMVLLVRI